MLNRFRRKKKNLPKNLNLTKISKNLNSLKMKINNFRKLGKEIKKMQQKFPKVMIFNG